MKFSDKVYALTKKIPKGKISTYKELAHVLKSKAYRAIGNALNKNPYWPDVPCHRIIKSDGTIGGFSRGVKEKIDVLRKEGIKVKNKKIIDFEKILFKF